MDRGPGVLSAAARKALAGQLSSRAREVAAAATVRFLAAHPDWVARYGERAQTAGEADAVFHVEALAAALHMDAPASFAGYGHWAARTLSTHGIATAALQEFLLLLADELCAPLDPAAGELVHAYTQAGVDAARERAAATDPLPDVAAAFRAAILSGQRDAASAMLRTSREQGAGAPFLADRVVYEALRSIGDMWQDGLITVAQEHLATAVAQYAWVAAGIPVRGAPGCGTALIAGVEGERHQLGAMLVGDVLAEAGWNAHFLGTDLPRRDVDRMARELAPRVVAISATLARNLPAVESLVSTLRGSLPPGASVLVGGRAFLGLDNPASAVGADLHFQGARDLAAWLHAAGTAPTITAGT